MLKKYFCVLAALLLVLSSGFVFAGENAVPETKDGFEGQVVGIHGTATTSFNFTYPHQVTRFRVSCTASSYFRVGIRDYGTAAYAGDIWDVTARIYDATNAQTQIQGTGSVTSYKYAHLWAVYAFATNPLQGYIEVRYHNGINVFPAAATLEVYCPGTLTLTNLGLSNF